MNVKKYVVNEMSEAMSLIKVELGSDAIILNTRNIKRKGFLGIFKSPMIEVIAATESTRNIRPEPTSYNADSRYHELLENKINNISEQFESFLNEAKEKQKAENIPITNDTNIVKQLEETSAPSIEMSNNEDVNKLIEADVNKEIATQIIKEAYDIKAKREDADITDIVKHLLIQKIGLPAPIKLSKYRRKIIFLVGPTGVGKTTTIAKLAAIFTLNKKAKVCLVTCDTYRIAATDQLGTYAEILNIPIEIVNNQSDFRAVLANHEQDDIILVDTVGRSPSDPVKKEEIMPLFEACDSYEVYLVMSATTSYKCAKHIYTNYEFLDDYKLIFTKLDETPYYGNLINILHEIKKNVGYITTGQNVPDDILELEESNLNYIIDKII